jgi:hypothetical protein
MLMPVTATLEALDICLLGRRSRERSFRIGGEGNRWDGGRLNLVHRRLLAPLGDDGLVVAARGLIPSATRSAGTGFLAPVVVLGAGVVAAPLRGMRPLALPAAAIVIVERPATDRELVLSVGLGDLGEGALARIAVVMVVIHGRRRGGERSRVGELISGSRFGIAVDIGESGWKP